jgi:hypothetical protein
MTQPTLLAPRFGLLFGEIKCHHCQAPSPTVAVWVPSHQDVDEEGEVDEGGAALLSYIQWLDPDALALLASRAPWVRMASTAMSGTTYLANHCTTCGTVQGDYYVFHPDGPYWPQEDSLTRMLFVEGRGSLKAVASAGQSMWMECVEHVALRD